MRKRIDLLIIVIVTLIVTSLHYFALSKHLEVHDFYRRLYYIPIILASFRFRLKGGTITSIVVSFLYLPHLYLFESMLLKVNQVNQILEMIMFLFIGTITGYLVEKLEDRNQVLTTQMIEIERISIINTQLLNSMDAALIYCDEDLNIVSFNLQLSMIVGDLNNLKSKKLDELEFYTHLREPIKKLKKNTIATYKNEVRFINPITNKKMDVKLNINRVIANNDVDGVLILLEDITESKEIQSQLHRSERLSALGVMASGIAHEIRNPLGIIKTIIQSISYENTEKSVIDEGYQIIIDEISRANKVIEGMLGFVRVKNVEYSVIDLQQLITEVVAMTLGLAKEGNVTIEYNTFTNLLINGNREQLKQVFINLIINAIQAIKDGGIITIIGKTEEKSIIIEVCDTGLGISEDDSSLLFTPFYTTKSDGTGLGLAIVHELITEHGGTIRVFNNEDTGATFRVEFPKIEEVYHE